MLTQVVMTLADRCRNSYPCHSPINHKVGSIHEAALIAGQEEGGLGLFNSFAEATRWEVDLATMTFGCVVAKEVLQERSAEDQSQKCTTVVLVWALL